MRPTSRPSKSEAAACWSLTELPMVGGDKVVSCDCGKEWWDKLEWDRCVQPSNYKPIHSQHYKKTMIRGSPLRCVCHRISIGASIYKNQVEFDQIARSPLLQVIKAINHLFPGLLPPIACCCRP